MNDQKRELFTYNVLSKREMFCFLYMVKKASLLHMYIEKKTSLLPIGKEIEFIGYIQKERRRDF